MLPCQLNIAIDGPAGAGKSSVARAVALALGLVYLDTGAMYRAITWKALEQQLPLTDAAQLGSLAATTVFSWGRGQGQIPELYMDGSPLPAAIRSLEVTSQVSLVASYEEVRSVLRQKQRDLGKGQGVIMDGRDIGTTVMPVAALKVFLTASLQERAGRRLREFGHDISLLPQKMQEMAERDRKDSSRQHSPLSIAADAIVIDTTGLSLSEVVDLVIKHAEAVCHNKEE